MADAWGTGGQAPAEGGASGDASPVNDENGENAPRAVDDEGSYSDAQCTFLNYLIHPSLHDLRCIFDVPIQNVPMLT